MNTLKLDELSLSKNLAHNAAECFIAYAQQCPNEPITEIGVLESDGFGPIFAITLKNGIKICLDEEENDVYFRDSDGLNYERYKNI